jgi:hypothetical protein
MSPRRPQSRAELKAHLEEQLTFLKSSGVLYDRGVEAEAKRLAVAARVLLHDTASSKSLLGQLDLKDCAKFYDSSSELPSPSSAWMTSYTALTATTLGGGPVRVIPRFYTS